MGYLPPVSERPMLGLLVLERARVKNVARLVSVGAHTPSLLFHRCVFSMRIVEHHAAGAD